MYVFVFGADGPASFSTAWWSSAAFPSENLPPRQLLVEDIDAPR